MSKIAQNKEKKRQVILNAALDVFISEGFIHAGMDKIAERSQVTKQTIYRYFPSKNELFKAVLEKIGENSEFKFASHLQKSDDREALFSFAKSFIHAHLLPDHLATFKLLIAENSQAPEIISTFHNVGPDETDLALMAFFRKRLNFHNPEFIVDMWTSTLLSLRTKVLMGMPPPSEQAVEEYANQCTDFLLAATASTALSR